MSATLTEAREALAAALSAIDGITVRARGPVRSPRPGDGWVTLSRLEPQDFKRSSATLVTVVVLGASEASAEELLDTWGVDLIDAAYEGEELPVAGVAVEPVTLVVDQAGAVLHALTLTLITEVCGG